MSEAVVSFVRARMIQMAERPLAWANTRREWILQALALAACARVAMGRPLDPLAHDELVSAFDSGRAPDAEWAAASVAALEGLVLDAPEDPERERTLQHVVMRHAGALLDFVRRHDVVLHTTCVRIREVCEAAMGTRDDIPQRAFTALREMPVPPVSPELRARVLGAVDDSLATEEGPGADRRPGP